MSEWLDFRHVKKQVRLVDVIRRYGVELGSSGPGCPRGRCPLPTTGAKHDGQIYYPTILTDVPLDAAIANEETFGSVVVVEAVDTPEDAIAAANRTMYGLTSSIFAGNTYKALEMAPR